MDLLNFTSAHSSFPVENPMDFSSTATRILYVGNRAIAYFVALALLIVTWLGYLIYTSKRYSNVDAIIQSSPITQQFLGKNVNP